MRYYKITSDYGCYVYSAENETKAIVKHLRGRNNLRQNESVKIRVTRLTKEQYTNLSGVN